MGKVYLTNAFSLNMINEKEFPTRIIVDKLYEVEFCFGVTNAIENKELVNAIGHDSTINLVNKLCETELEKNRTEIKMEKDDRALIIMVSERLPEGKVLDDEEITKLFKEEKIKFYEVIL